MSYGAILLLHRVWDLNQRAKKSLNERINRDIA